MQSSVRIRAAVGAATPVAFAIVLVALTFAERGFLERVGWSAVHRTEVEWPSLLALGPYGWVMVAVFLVAGAFGLTLASAVWSASRFSAERVQAALIAAMSIAIALEAFRPDSPQASGARSWHDAVHNAVFPAIPVASLAAGALGVFVEDRVQRRSPTQITTVVLWTTMVVGLVLTGFDGVAQLARYVYFAALLLWIELVALGIFARAA